MAPGANLLPSPVKKNLLSSEGFFNKRGHRVASLPVRAIDIERADDHRREPHLRPVSANEMLGKRFTARVNPSIPVAWNHCRIALFGIRSFYPVNLTGGKV